MWSYQGHCRGLNPLVELNVAQNERVSFRVVRDRIRVSERDKHYCEITTSQDNGDDKDSDNDKQQRQTTTAKAMAIPTAQYK